MVEQLRQIEIVSPLDEEIVIFVEIYPELARG